MTNATATFSLPDVISCLGAAACRFDIDLYRECDSTNRVLLDRAAAGAPTGTVVQAETQTAGRGRRGRAWFSAPGDSLLFSMLWRMPNGISPAGLSLAAGVAVAKAIEEISPDPAASVRLKWPNDLLCAGRKLGGILVEMQGDAAVIGIGLNLRLPAAMPDDLRLCSAALDAHVNANHLFAEILIGLLRDLERFSADGFAALRTDWLARHAFENAPIRLLSDFAPPQDGICRGVDTDGALLFEVDGRIERILAGEVSLRAAQ